MGHPLYGAGRGEVKVERGQGEVGRALFAELGRVASGFNRRDRIVEVCGFLGFVIDWGRGIFRAWKFFRFDSNCDGEGSQ